MRSAIAKQGLVVDESERNDDSPSNGLLRIKMLRVNMSSGMDYRLWMRHDTFQCKTLSIADIRHTSIVWCDLEQFQQVHIAVDIHSIGRLADWQPNTALPWNFQTTYALVLKM